LMRNAATVGGARRALRVGVALFAGAIVLFAGCGPEPLPPPQTQHEIVVAVRPGPASWFPGAHGALAGFDHDLLIRFAREQNLPLRVVIVESAATLLALVATGKVHIGAGGLFQGASAKDDGTPSGDPVLWSAGTYAVEPVLIYNRDGFKPRSFADLEGATVAYGEGTGIDAQLAAARAAHPEVTWLAVDVPSSDALIAQVADGTIDYAVVPSNDAAVAQNAYLDFAVAFPAGPRRLLAWAVAPGQRALRDALDVFLNQLRGDGGLARYAERYFAPVQRVERIDGEVFRERIRTMLPTYRRDFENAQAGSGIDWRLLAAVAYQESQWDPYATSETGVRGLMQLTEETARRFRVADRLDARASIGAAGRYLRELKSKMPARIGEPDRTWLALAAFNIGIAHLEDARILAQKQKLNPDVWSDVRKALPLLAQPEYYADAKYGYARGGMPVAFVDRVRAYYDILLRAQPAPEARLQLFVDTAPGPR
ncbi:MAG: membrane-bound lytic murein transglycosylase MltF, partial [Betaproteobacteria bacterium]